MAVRPVPDIVQKTGDAEDLLDEVFRGRVRADLTEAGIQVAAEFTGDVHGPQRMLEARVFRGRVHPPGALELVDPPQALHPGGVDQVLFRALARLSRDGDREGGVLVDRVGDERHALVYARRIRLLLFHDRKHYNIRRKRANPKGGLRGASVGRILRLLFDFPVSPPSRSAAVTCCLTSGTSCAISGAKETHHSRESTLTSAGGPWEIPRAFARSARPSR